MDRNPPPTWIGRSEGRDSAQETGGGDAVEGAVEIDEVEARRTFVRIAPGELERIPAFERDGLPSSLREPYDTPREDVDGGNDLELTC